MVSVRVRARVSLGLVLDSMLGLWLELGIGLQLWLVSVFEFLLG